MDKMYDVLLISFTGSNVSKELERIARVYDEKEVELNVSFPGALAHLGTKLIRNGYTCDYLSSFEDFKDELKEKLTTNDYKYVGISTTHITDFESLEKIAAFVKKYKPSATIFVGGPFIVAKTKQFTLRELQLLYKKIGADIYFNSYAGGDKLIEIIEALNGKREMADIKNITFRSGNQFIKNETEIEYESLEDCNLDWKLFGDQNLKIVPIRASISCPYSCTFCAYPIHSGKHQIRTIDNVERELNQIYEMGKTQIVHFIDDNLNVPTERFKDMLLMMKRNQYNFKWFSYVRCQFITDELAQLMKETGCVAVILGLESGNQEMLNRMNKKTTVEDLTRGISILKKHGIATMGFFFVGFPGETEESVNDTINFINNAAPDFYAVVPWYYDITTPISKQKEAYNLVGNNYQWSHATMDYGKAEELCNEFPKRITNSTIKTIQTHHVFEMLAHGFELDEVKSILKNIGNEVRLGKNLRKK